MTQALNKIAAQIDHHRFVIFAFFTALCIRLLLAFLPGFKFDIDAWFAWAIRLQSLDFSHFYSPTIWTNYTPGYLYILSFLAQLKQLFSLTDSQFYYLLKIAPIIIDLILAGVIYQFALTTLKPKLALALTCLILFNPFVIFNSAVWGQIDALLSLFMLLSIIALSRHQLVNASVYFALAILVKPQALSVAPVFLTYLLTNLNRQTFSKLVLPGLATLYLLSLPFFTSNFIFGPLSLIKQMTDDYPYNSLFAFNLWGGLGFWIKDTNTLLGLSYHFWGLTTLLIYWLGLGWLYFKKRIDLFDLATLTTLGFYFLPTRIHDRYLYPALIFLLISVIRHRDWKLLLIDLLLSFIHFINLYYVYVYYNEVFPNTDHLLYNPIIYLRIEHYSNLLSIVSFGLFSYIVWRLTTKYRLRSKPE